MKNLILKVFAYLGSASALLLFIKGIFTKMKMERTKAENSRLEALNLNLDKKLKIETELIKEQKKANENVTNSKQEATLFEKENNAKIEEAEKQDDKSNAMVNVANDIVDLFNKL